MTRSCNHIIITTQKIHQRGRITSLSHSQCIKYVPENQGHYSNDELSTATIKNVLTTMNGNAFETEKLRYLC